MPQVKEKIRKSGIVVESLPSTTFKVRLEDGQEVLAHLAGRLRLYFIKILPGDKVIVEFNPNDLSRGRIIRRE